MGENLQTVERLLDVVEVIATEGKALGVSEIASKVALPKSTVHRLLQTLLKRNYLQKSVENEKYTLSSRFLTISAKYYSGLDLRNAAGSLMRDLSEKTQTTVHLAIRNGDSAIYIEKIKPFTYTCSYSEIGKSIPLYCSSIGKVLLASLNDNEIDEYFNHLEIIKFTNKTLSITDLKAQIEKVRQNDLAFDCEEHEENTFCLGTPIKNFQGNVIAALSIASSSKEILTNELYIKALQDCAKQISLQFGYVES